MIPVKLTVSGFLSYQEPAELDFTGIHVACISGHNGAGKSAMLDAITWALFGEARKNDDSIINDAPDINTARVDFEFIYEDADYLVRRQKTRGKSTVVEFYIRDADGESWKPLTEKKVTDTNKRICAILRMDYKTFINASFFLQGKADQFTGQNPTERKKILSTILNLEIWEVYKAKTTEKRKLAEKRSEYLRGLIEEAENELKQEQQLRDTLKTAQQEAEQAEKDYHEADEKWQLAKANEASLKILKENAERKQQEETRQSRMIMEQQNGIGMRSSELEKLNAEISHADAIEKNYNELLSVRLRLDRLMAAAAEFSRLQQEQVRLESSVKNVENRLKYELQQLTNEKTELNKLLPEKQNLELRYQEELAAVESLTKSCSSLSQIREELSVISNQGAEKNIVLKNLDEKIQKIQEELRTLLAYEGALCPTCGREMDAEHCRIHAGELNKQIQVIQQQREQTMISRDADRRKYAELQSRIKVMETQEKELNTRRLELTRVEHSLHTLTERLNSWNGKEQRLTELENILKNAEFCPEEWQELERINQETEALGYDRQEHERLNTLKNQLTGAEEEHNRLIKAQSMIEPLKREISEKQDQLWEAEDRLIQLREERSKAEADFQQLNAVMPDIKQIETERLRMNQLRDRANKELGQAEQRVSHLEAARSTMQSRGVEYQEMQTEIHRYKDLEKAFGKDGIPALLIEQAVPEIEEQANEILQQLTNGSMSLQLNTQGTYKSKKDEVKETLEILISDPYGVREYEMFSGGEAFRINFSIRLALSRILARRAGSRLQTLVIDEGFGSQDEEGRARLAEAITAVQNDFEKILVITHLPELKEVFPARIEVEKTLSGSHMEVIL